MLEIDETPDSTRPRNVWPRLIAFGILVLVAIGAVVACVAAFAGSVPPRQLSVPLAQVEVGLPRLLPVATWGADSHGNTFGAWVVIMPDNGDAHAYLSRDPASGCQVQWKIVVDGGVAKDAFVDACNPAVQFGLDGKPTGAPVPRTLDHFDVSLVNGKLVVPIEQVQLGDCSSPGAATATPTPSAGSGGVLDGAGCSTPGHPLFKHLPAGPLAGVQGLRQQQ